MNILNQLKESTKEYHSELESTFPFSNLFYSPEISSYLATIIVLYSFLEPLELKLKSLKVEFDTSERWKIPKLITDLEEVGIAKTTYNKYPKCNLLPEINSIFATYGVWYVLEGSTLGAKTFVNKLEKLNYPIKLNFNYFNGYREKNAKNWSCFTLTLLECSSNWSDSERLNVVNSAIKTFACLQNWAVECSKSVIGVRA
jgi:heme oxygenase (biliverdin-IX-beta and delta-forming)